MKKHMMPNLFFFENENEAIELFKKMWDSGIKSYEYDLEDSKKIMDELNNSR